MPRSTGWGEQPFIEAQLARRHLKEGALSLYDVTSTYLEGRCCELAQYGYSRDHRADRPQIVIGMLAGVAEVEQNEKHPWHKLLGDLTANAFVQTSS